MPTPRRPDYFYAETQALRRVLNRLNRDQRARYVEECRATTGHASTGRLYDASRMRIAERILLEDHRAAYPRPEKTHG